MSVTRYYLQNTQTNAGTGGTIYDLTATIGSAGSVNNSTNQTAFTLTQAWQQTFGTTVTGTSFDISVNIASITGTAESRFRIARVDSPNNVQAASSYSTTYNTTGTKTFTLTLSTTWSAGDRLRLEQEVRRAGGHGNVSFEISTGNSNSYVDADITPVALYSGNMFLMF